MQKPARWRLWYMFSYRITYDSPIITYLLYITIFLLIFTFFSEPESVPTVFLSTFLFQIFFSQKKPKKMLNRKKQAPARISMIFFPEITSFVCLLSDQTCPVPLGEACKPRFSDFSPAAATQINTIFAPIIIPVEPRKPEIPKDFPQ